MESNQLYTELIIEYSTDTENKKFLENRTHYKMGVNPSCGDEIEISLILEDDIIKDASYEGIGCAISRASTAMMIDLIKNKHLREVKKIVKNFLEMIKNKELSKEDIESLGDAYVLENVSKLPARVKCAVLSWRTLEEIIK